MSWYGDWAPYVPVAKRKANAASLAAKTAKKENRTPAPIVIKGRAIAASFWGKAWCDHLEKFSDFSNRLPRGRTYVRNGSVVDLQIHRGKIKAIVAGSEVYTVTVDIKTLPSALWTQIKNGCTHSALSLIDLLQGKFDAGIMARLTAKDDGLFPKPTEISMRCSCPDAARMCKHVAAVLYGVGARLDSAPELLFTLRDVDHFELIRQAVNAETLDESLRGQTDGALAGSDLGEIFGIELDVSTPQVAFKKNATGKAARTAKAKTEEAPAKKPRKRRAVSATPAEVRALENAGASSVKTRAAPKRVAKR